MSDNKFHDHLDVCTQCREHPFNLCSTGSATLRAEATRVTPADVLTSTHPLFDPACTCPDPKYGWVDDVPTFESKDATSCPVHAPDTNVDAFVEPRPLG